VIVVLGDLEEEEEEEKKVKQVWVCFPLSVGYLSRFVVLFLLGILFSAFRYCSSYFVHSHSIAPGIKACSEA
jgi:hypothetical protein